MQSAQDAQPRHAPARSNSRASMQRKPRSMRAGCEGKHATVAFVAEGMRGEKTCGSGGGGDIHRVSTQPSISPMRSYESACSAAAQLPAGCRCSERAGAKVASTRDELHGWRENTQREGGSCVDRQGIGVGIDLLTPEQRIACIPCFAFLCRKALST